MPKAHQLRTIDATEFNNNEDRFELRSGLEKGAPPCPFGGKFMWIGYDKTTKEYIRFTTSVFKRMIMKLDPLYIKANEATHAWYKKNNGHGTKI